jgi:hypothetical protein
MKLIKSIAILVFCALVAAAAGFVVGQLVQLITHP